MTHTHWELGGSLPQEAALPTPGFGLLGPGAGELLLFSGSGQNPGRQSDA